jgi:hypothetical protein
MKRLSLFVAAAALTMIVWSPSVSAAMEEKTIKGEVIDMKCHKGKGHEGCATQCVRRGEAAGIKVGDEVYMIVGDFTNDKNAKLVEFVAKDVEATGEIGEADGHKTIKVSAIKLAGS